MTPQEAALLKTFLDQLAQVKGVSKDREADALITEGVASQPDAPYLLVQRALLLEQALNVAKEQIARLQSELQSAPEAQQSGRFLGDMNAWGRNPSPASQPNARTAPGSVSPAAPSTTAAPAPVQAPGAGRSFFANAAATAAGVVGGAFLFQGIGNLLGHGGGGFLPHTTASLPANEDVTVNNFYGNEATGPAELANVSDPDLGLDTPLDGQDFADEGLDDSSWT